VTKPGELVYLHTRIGVAAWHCPTLKICAATNKKGKALAVSGRARPAPLMTQSVPLVPKGGRSKQRNRRLLKAMGTTGSLVTGVMGGQANTPEGVSATGGVSILSPAVAASETLRLLSDPWSDSVLARWPDSYTMIPTFASKDMAHVSLTIYGGTTTADGAAGMYVRGDPVDNYSQVTSVGAASSGYPITWHSAWGNLNDSMPGLTDAAAQARPVAAGWRVTFSGIGAYHTVVARIMELPPNGNIDSGFDNFPTNANVAPTFVQREFFRAREVVMKPGDTLVLVSYPCDASSLRFAGCKGRVREYSLATKSWSGYIVWFFGLSSVDTLYMDAIMHHEWYPPSFIATMPATAPLPRALVKPSMAETEKALGTVVENVSKGWNVFDTVLDVGLNLFEMISPFIFQPSPGVIPVPPSSGLALIPSVPLVGERGAYGFHRVVVEDEHKDSPVVVRGPPLR